MGSGKRRKCKCCRKLFRPDRRNRQRQYYCSAPDCRAASKAASQARWLSKPENQGYFRGPVNVARVQTWRSGHPGYWRKERPADSASPDVLTAQSIGFMDKTDDVASAPLQEFLSADADPALQDGLTAQPIGFTDKMDDIASVPLQEFLSAQPAVLIGLIAHLVGTPLQDDIVRTTGRLLRLGQDILATSAAGVAPPMPDCGAGGDQLRDLRQDPRLP
jgi:hypothetical protein